MYRMVLPLLPLLLAVPATAQVAGGPESPVTPGQCPDNMVAYGGSDEVVTCSCPAAQVRTGSVWGTDTYTADSATCRAALHAGKLGRQGGTVTVRMLPGGERYPGTTRNGVASSNYGAFDASFRFEGEPGDAAATSGSTSASMPEAPQATAPSQCPDNMVAYGGSDEVINCVCPGEATLRGSVWGTDTYTADSATCRAAVHAGKLGRQGGTVTVRMLPGGERYPGTTRNGVASSNYGAFDASYHFEGEPSDAAATSGATSGSLPEPPQATAPSQCPDNMVAYGGSDEVINCVCPGEATLRGSVWGTDTYTADSATCRAAVHAGMLAPTGGTVTVRMLPGGERYPGTTRNGVASSNYGAFDASFRFEGEPRPMRAGTPVQAPVAASLQRTGQVQLYVTFRTGSADLDISAAPVLTQVRDALVSDPGLRLRFTGHTDSTGTAAINLPLSRLRAESVRQWLVAGGIDAGRLDTEGLGSGEPIADNATEAGRSLNRRVQAAIAN